MAASRKEYPMTEHPSSKSKRDAIRRISRDTGVSESSIYKILANPFSFSRSTVDMVRREVEKYGLTLSGDGLSEGVPESSSPRRPLRISVVIPSRPLYFWREAVAGIEKSKAVLEKEGIPIQLRYSYHSFPQTEPDSLSLFSALESDNSDGLILFPVGGQACRVFLETASIPTVIFNDTQDYMTPDWFRAHAHTVFIGPDGYGEGERAASLIASCGVDIRSLGVICTRHNSSAQVSEQRVKGVCDKARELFPEAQIFHIELDPTARIAPSTLAQRLIGCFDGGDVDCLYISSGVTHIACAAIEKIERRLARPLATFVIGHECSSADRRYLMEGRQRGYIKQDVYTQGFFALKDVAETCLGVGQLIGRLYPSSIFIR